ncbi:MAG: hypothetical protein WCI22_04345, partial [Actinomycetota bacterium]
SRFMQLGGYTENWPDLSEGELWLRLSLTGSRLQLVAEPLCHYVLSSTQMTSDRTVVARHQMAGLQMILESGLLDDRQLRIAESEVSRLRSVLVAIVARQAVVERRSRARRGAFAAARSGGLTFRQRCSLLTMSVVPATAAHIWSTPLERQVAHGKDSIRPRSSS